MDVKKLGRIPTGGGWKARRRGQAEGRQRVGYAYIHSVVDDHSRLAYSEVLGDERARTVVGFWDRALAWLTERGVPVRAVLTDNGPAYLLGPSRDQRASSGAHMAEAVSGRAYDERDVNDLVLAAREAAEELYIITRLGTRRTEPIQRWRRLAEPLKPFEATEA